MKKRLLYAGMGVLTLGMLLTSCEEDKPEYNSTETILVGDEGSIRYDSDGVWTENLEEGFINIDDYEFSHQVPYPNYVSGFTPSRVSDTKEYTPLYEHPYASISGGGLKGAGSSYLVAFWDSYNEGDTFNTRTCRIFAEDGDLFMPQSVMVNNTTYAYYAMLNGNGDLSKKFAEGDWLTLTAHGVHADNSETEATFWLANIISSDVASGIVTKWTEFDLSGLGVCKGIYFTMDSSDSSEWGMNTPAYFCLDKLVVKE